MESQPGRVTSAHHPGIQHPITCPWWDRTAGLTWPVASVPRYGSDLWRMKTDHLRGASVDFAIHLHYEFMKRYRVVYCTYIDFQKIKSVSLGKCIDHDWNHQPRAEGTVLNVFLELRSFHECVWLYVFQKKRGLWQTSLCTLLLMWWSSRQRKTSRMFSPWALKLWCFRCGWTSPLEPSSSGESRDISYRGATERVALFSVTFVFSYLSKLLLVQVSYYNLYLHIWY